MTAIGAKRSADPQRHKVSSWAADGTYAAPPSPPTAASPPSAPTSTSAAHSASGRQSAIVQRYGEQFSPGAAARADAVVAEIAEADVIGVQVFWRLSRGSFGPVNGYGLAAGSSFSGAPPANATVMVRAGELAEKILRSRRCAAMPWPVTSWARGRG